jgi:hypothetical protein
MARPEVRVGTKQSCNGTAVNHDVVPIDELLDEIMVTAASMGTPELEAAAN